MSKKTITPLIVLGSVAAGALVYQSCQKPKKSQNIKKIKKWIDWEIEFKENTSDLEKAKAINAIEKYLIDYLFQKELSGTIFKSIKFSYSKLDTDYLHIIGTVVLKAIGLTVPHFPLPPFPHPKTEEFMKMSSFIKKIEDVNKGNLKRGFQ